MKLIAIITLFWRLRKLGVKKTGIFLQLSNSYETFRKDRNVELNSVKVKV